MFTPATLRADIFCGRYFVEVMFFVIIILGQKIIHAAKLPKDHLSEFVEK
jgi:hypothetical protein